MALPTRPNTSWTGSFDFPSRLFETGRNDYQLYEEDDEFVLSVELPGFDPAEIDLTWDDGILNIAAERHDESRGERRTYHRRFRFPKAVDSEEIDAQYENGVLEVTLPHLTGATARGEEIPIEA
ncbi:MAG: Hsp20/alpha crystallin family protein [Halobaculum sp.]|jgi:HSP20 family protein